MIRPKWRAVLLCCYYKWRRIYSGIFSTRTGDLLQKAGPTNIRQTLEDDGHQWRDTTLWRNRNVSINFIPSIFVIVISQVGFFGFLDCIESQKVSLVKQKFLIIWGFVINAVAKLQPATHIYRFKILNVLDKFLLYMTISRFSCTKYTLQIGENSSCTNAWI